LLANVGTGPTGAAYTGATGETGSTGYTGPGLNVNGVTNNAIFFKDATVGPTGSSKLTFDSVGTGSLNIDAHVLPQVTDTYDLGSATYKWRDLYLSSASIYMSTTKISLATDGNLQIAIGAGSATKVATSANPVSSFTTLNATTGYVSALTASSITAVNFIYLSSVQDTFYISTTNLDAQEITYSSLIGRDASTLSLRVSTINDVKVSDYVSTGQLTSSITGLGAAGYISSTQLTSTTTGLATSGYLSSSQLATNISTVSSFSRIIQTSSISLSSLFTTGNVGIGIAAPVTPLHIETNGVNQGILINHTLSTNNYLLTLSNSAAAGFLGFHSALETGSYVLGSSRGDMVVRMPQNRRLHFTNTNSEALLTISSLNVGVGTVNPGHTLDVAGNIRFSGALLGKAGAASNDWAVNIITSTTSGQGIIFGYQNATGNAADIHYYYIGNNATTNRLALGTYNNGDILNVMNDGKVGIGKTNPGFQLDLSTDGARKLSSPSWTTGSDIRLKTNIIPADTEVCYSNVKSIPLKRYTWRNDLFTEEQITDRSKLGWIAQDVETVFPKAVTKHSEYGYEDCRSLDVDQIYATLYGATQKLIQKVEVCESTIMALQNEVSTLRG
jgi:hypothetical protein